MRGTETKTNSNNLLKMKFRKNYFKQVKEKRGKNNKTNIYYLNKTITKKKTQINADYLKINNSWTLRKNLTPMI